MRQASTSKAFSGAVALSLVGQGELSLNDTIGEYLPGLPKSWHGITLRQLLDHKSGLPNFTADQGYLRALSANPKNPPAPRKLLFYVEDEPLNFEPGSEHRYSNTDNVTVGLMVQVVTGDTYKRQLREQVLGPLGLQKIGLPRGANLRQPYIHGYDNDASRLPPEDTSEVLASGWVWFSGSMVSTPYDFNDFVRGYVGGELFGRRIQAEQRRVGQGGSSELPGPERTRRVSASSATKRGARPSGVTRGTTRATRSSWPQAPTASGP